MPSYSSLLSLLPLVRFTNADSLELRQAFDPFHACSDCFRSSWTQGPECIANTVLLSTISRILNPPAEATPTFTPSQWCSDYLRQTDVATFRVNTTAISTSTSLEYYEPLVTVTDLSRPTSTVLCPLPSPGMECGWDSNTISPLAQGQDGSVLDDGIGSAEECHQACLQRPACKAYRWDGSVGNPCGIFNVGIGLNAANLINPTPGGTQWFDRNCPADLPVACAVGRYPYINATAVAPQAVALASALALPPVITPAPVATPGIVASVPTPPSLPVQSLPGLPVVANLSTLPIPPSPPIPPSALDLPLPPNLPNLPVPLDIPDLAPPAIQEIPPPVVPNAPPPGFINVSHPFLPNLPSPDISAPPLPLALPIPPVHALKKRGAPFPPHFADLSYIWSSVYVTPACSCIISSALPPVPSNTTATITRYNATVAVTTTFVDPFTVTVTPREVTVYSRVY